MMIGAGPEPEHATPGPAYAIRGANDIDKAAYCLKREMHGAPIRLIFLHDDFRR